MTSALGTHDPTFGQAATPFGIGNGFDGIPDVQELQTVSPQTATNVQYNGRVDYQATDKDRIAFSAYFTPVSSTYYNGPQRSANNWNHSQLAESWTGLYTRTISPTTLNEARFSANGWNWNEVNTNPKEPFGLPTGNISSIGNVNVQSFGAQTPSQFDQLTYNGRDTLTKVQNSHSLKFGADISHAQFLDTAPWEGVPSYNFNNLWDFANDAPIQENGTNFNPVTGAPTSATKNLRFNIIGVFVQDDWKVKKNLTVNLGLRWEYFSPLTETKGNISNPILGQPPTLSPVFTCTRAGTCSAPALIILDRKLALPTTQPPSWCSAAARASATTWNSWPSHPTAVSIRRWWLTSLCMAPTFFMPRVQVFTT